MKAYPQNSIPKHVKRGCILEICLVHISQETGVRTEGRRSKVMLVEVGVYQWNLMGIDGNRVFYDSTEYKENKLSQTQLLDMLEIKENYLQYEVKYMADSISGYYVNQCRF